MRRCAVFRLAVFRLAVFRLAVFRLAVPLVAVAAFAGCGSGGAPLSAPSGSSPSVGAASGDTGPGLASSAATPTPPQPVPTRRADCVASTEEVTIRAESPGAICVLVGARLRVTSQPSPMRPWQPLSTSDTGVLSCTSANGPDGTVEGTCRALAAGTAVLSTQTQPGKGGPDGPPDILWRLTVRVMA
jgi:hypothetical protein